MKTPTATSKAKESQNEWLMLNAMSRDENPNAQREMSLPIPARPLREARNNAPPSAPSPVAVSSQP